MFVLLQKLSKNYFKRMNSIYLGFFIYLHTPFSGYVLDIGATRKIKGPTNIFVVI